MIIYLDLYFYLLQNIIKYFILIKSKLLWPALIIRILKNIYEYSYILGLYINIIPNKLIQNGYIYLAKCFKRFFQVLFIFIKKTK